MADDYIYDEDLLLEAARYAITQKTSRNQFMKLAKQVWYKADAEWRGRRWEYRKRAKEEQNAHD
jgi:hypothetical protein